MEVRVRETGETMYEDEFRRWLRANDGPSYDVLTPEVMELLGVDQVFDSFPPVGDVYQYPVRNGVELRDGLWYARYSLGPVFTDPAEEAAYKARRDAEQADAVRAQRNEKLTACDWTQLPDAPVDKAGWAAYRQALRDVTAQSGFPWTVTWPTKPE